MAGYFSDPEGGVLRHEAGTSNVTVVPAPPLVELAADNPTASGSGVAVVELVLSSAPPTPITVTYTLGKDGDPGTADADSADFAGGLHGSVEIGMGAREAAIRIAFTDDEDIEPTREFFTLVLDEPAAESGYDVGTERTAVAEILEGVCDRTPAIGAMSLTHPLVPGPHFADRQLHPYSSGDWDRAKDREPRRPREDSRVVTRCDQK